MIKERRAWNISSPEDVDLFDRETTGQDEAAEMTLYVMSGNPTKCEFSREDFLREIQDRVAGGEKIGVGASYAAWEHGGARYSLLECWVVDPSEEDEAEPEAKPGPMTRTGPLRPVFSFMGWNDPTPEESRWDYRPGPSGIPCVVICPEPTCLLEREDHSLKGRVVVTGEEGKPIMTAAPCPEHSDSFSFDAPWYQAFAQAYYGQLDERLGPPEPRSCGNCGRRYTSHLWQMPWDWCPSCTHRETVCEIDYVRLFDLRTTTMEMGRRHGLGSKAMEYDHLRPADQERCLNTLLDFIGNANSERRTAGVDANASTDLEAEYDRRHPVAEILSGPRHAEPETVHDNLPWCCILGSHGGGKS